jgi:hypothetical protein
MTELASDSLDLRHAATDHATIVTVPARRMLAVDGVGAPTGTDHRRAMTALHDIADHLRTRVRQREHVDPRLGPIECAWWTHPEPPPEELGEQFQDRSTWHWQLMIEVPKRATEEDVAAAIAEAGGSAPMGVPVRVVEFEEGRSAQILHVGGSGSAADAVARLAREVAASGGRPHGHLHEIHLSDPRHVGPDRARAILRLPIETASH